MRRTVTRISGVALLVTLAVLGSATTASAVQARRTFTATFATGGAAGSAVLVMYPNNSGVLTVRVDGLPANTTFSQVIYKGLCGKPVALIKLPTIRTNASGHGARVIALKAPVAVAIWSVGAAGTAAYRIAAPAFTRCSTFGYAVATRIAISKYGIDLPVVYQEPGKYPYCNVAMYTAGLSQPGEAGPTMIYAHARTGMFLPLLNASKIRNGAAMIGVTVKVWTSDDRLWTYQVTKVLRHVYSLPFNNDYTGERLWLQTSEGPHGTPNKLMVVAKRISVEAATEGDAHPKPRIVICH